MKIGSIIPAILVCAFSVDLAYRAIPCLSPDTGYRFRHADSPYEPFKKVRVHVRGDLSRLGNLPDTSNQMEEFTTDELGYRNRPIQFKTSPPDVILAGDSYSLAGSEKETLSYQLAKLTGHPVFNASAIWGITSHDAIYPPFALHSPDRIIELASRLKMKHGLVIRELAQRIPMPTMESIRLSNFDTLRERLGNIAAVHGLADYLAFARSFLLSSPLELMAQQKYQQLENGIILPNRSSSVIICNLGKGQPMLFYPFATNINDDTFKYWSWYDRQLKSHGLSLLVVLVPDKYTVYNSLLQIPATDGWSTFDEQRTANCLKTLEEELHREGIASVDLTLTLRAAAAAALKNGKYLYRLDDTHWNEEGIQVAALRLRPIVNQMLAKLTCSPICEPNRKLDSCRQVHLLELRQRFVSE